MTWHEMKENAQIYFIEILSAPDLSSPSFWNWDTFNQVRIDANPPPRLA